MTKIEMPEWAYATVGENSRITVEPGVASGGVNRSWATLRSAVGATGQRVRDRMVAEIDVLADGSVEGLIWVPGEVLPIPRTPFLSFDEALAAMSSRYPGAPVEVNLP
jgi:hypothetical protein